MVQHTIQLVPRLPEPTLVTGVLVKPNEPVKKGQPLFQFDRRPYEYKVNAVRAQLAAAQQQVKELKAQLEAAAGSVAEAKARRSASKAALDAATAQVIEAKAKRATLKSALVGATDVVAQAKAGRELAKSRLGMDEGIMKASPGAVSEYSLDVSRRNVAQAEAMVAVAVANEAQARVAYEGEAESAIQVALANEQRARVVCDEEAPAAIRLASANEEKARLAYESQIGGENTTVAQLRADLAQAQYYLDNTTLVAPEDGYVINLQVREGMVSGYIRIGAIASFVIDADRYVLATYSQEELKYIKNGQPAEVAMDLYPGQIFKGSVSSIWWGSGEGQLLPSGELPVFGTPPPKVPQGRFAVKIALDEPDQGKFPIGAQGATAIYTKYGAWAALRRIGIRGRTWLNWLYPLPF